MDPTEDLGERLLTALDRLRDAVFLAKDKAVEDGVISEARAHRLVLLAADVAIASDRLSR